MSQHLSLTMTSLHCLRTFLSQKILVILSSSKFFPFLHISQRTRNPMIINNTTLFQVCCSTRNLQGDVLQPKVKCDPASDESA